MELKHKVTSLTQPYFKTVRQAFNFSDSTAPAYRWRLKALRGYRASLNGTRRASRRTVDYVRQHSGEWLSQFKMRSGLKS